MDYSKYYDHKCMARSDGFRSLANGHLKFGDAFSAVCYAHGISYAQMTTKFSLVEQNNRYEGTEYSLQQQLDFIRDNATRSPGAILEIGGGRGEVTAFLDYMGYDVTTVEPGSDAPELFASTTEKLFPGHTPTWRLLNTSIHTADIDYSEYDTILMVESLEHILSEHWDPQWELITENFSGRFVVVNWINYHPIQVGQYAPPHIHCRLVDDALYDEYVSAGVCWARQGSHLVVDL